MTKSAKKASKSRTELLRDTLERVKNQPGAPALIEAYESLRSMNSLQEIQRQIASMPPAVIISSNSVC
jgi:hypothetical protein